MLINIHLVDKGISSAIARACLIYHGWVVGCVEWGGGGAVHIAENAFPPLAEALGIIS